MTQAAGVNREDLALQIQTSDAVLCADAQADDIPKIKPLADRVLIKASGNSERLRPVAAVTGRGIQ